MIKEQKFVRNIELFGENGRLYAQVGLANTIPWVNGNPPEFILWHGKLWKFIWRRADDLCGYEKFESFVNSDLTNGTELV